MLPLSVVACGGGDDGGGTDNGTPTGTHYGYVVNKANVVAPGGSSSTAYGLDLGSDKSSTLDGKVDNRLGAALGALSGFFDIQGTIDAAVAKGSLILLVDFQTTDFTNNSAGAGLAVKFGANPMPAACSSATDTTCGHHLDGTGSFTIATDSPTDASLGGKIVNGTYTGGPGNVSLAIALGSSTPIELSLLHARAKATGITADGIATLTVGGVLTMSDLATKVGPAIQTSVAAVIAASCTAGGAPPDCGCTGTALQIVHLLDGDITTAVKDCKITVDEILGYPLVAQLLLPDSCSQATCTTPDSLSIGVQVTAKKATFPM